MKMPQLAEYGKFIAAIAGVTVEYLTAHYANASWLSIVVAAASALGVFAVPNATKPPA